MSKRKKVQEKWEKRHKMTFKELEWDYLPLIVLFGVVSGILTLLLILLIIFEQIQIQERNNQIDVLIRNQNIRRYLNSTEVTPTPTVVILEEVTE